MLSSEAFFTPATQPGLPRDLISDDERGIASKPLWTLSEAADVARELARGGAAVTLGEVLDVRTGTPHRLDLPAGLGGDPALMPRTGLHWRYRRWSCARAEDETWERFASRAADTAAMRIAGLADASAGIASHDLRVDLAWALPDELALFDRPWQVRDRCEAAMRGQGFHEAQYADHGRVARASPTGSAARGSFFGTAAASLEDIPGDARYVRLGHATTGLAHLADLQQLEAVSCSNPVAVALTHIARLPRLRHVDIARLGIPLDAFAGLHGLEWLSFDQNPYARSGPHLLAPLAGLQALRYLYARATLRDLEALPALPALATLQITHLAPRLASLAPIARLAALRTLTVHARRIDDASLAPLAALRHVRHFELWSDPLPLEQYALLARAWPEAEGTLRARWQPTSPPTLRGIVGTRGRACAACGDEMVQTLWRPRKAFCLRCEPKLAARAADAWEAAMEPSTG